MQLCINANFVADRDGYACCVRPALCAAVCFFPSVFFSAMHLHFVYAYGHVAAIAATAAVRCCGVTLLTSNIRALGPVLRTHASAHFQTESQSVSSSACGLRSPSTKMRASCVPRSQAVRQTVRQPASQPAPGRTHTMQLLCFQFVNCDVVSLYM